MITKIFWGMVTLLVVVIVALYFVIDQRSETVREINAFVQVGSTGLPRQVDEYTVLESVYSEEMEIYFEYSMQKYNDYSENVHRESVLGMFKSLVCKTPRFKQELLENGVKFNFLYKEVSGANRVFKFGKESCQ